MELRHVAVLIALWGAAFAGCTRVEAPKSSPNVPLAEGGFGGESSGGSGSLAGASGDGSAGEFLSNAGAPGALEIGVWPTFAADPEQTRDVQAVLASVSALSLGATTLPLAERWDELSGATGSPRAAAWSRLDAMTGPYRDRDAGVALCIGIVDREVPAWPEGVDLATEAASSAIERTIDEVFARYAEQLSHLCFGYQVDRYLAAASSTSQKQLLAFLKHAVDYAAQHPLRRSETAIGTAVTLDAVSGASKALLEQLMLGDEVVAVYDPLDADAVLKAPESVAGEVTEALQSLAGAQGVVLPLALFEVGYPSLEDAGSSEQAQKKYYDTLLELLDSERQGVSFVGAFGLADRAPADCEAEAMSFGGTPTAQAQRALVRCSMGLRAESADTGATVDKLAWPSVVAAVSRYR